MKCHEVKFLKVFKPLQAFILFKEKKLHLMVKLNVKLVKYLIVELFFAKIVLINIEILFRFLYRTFKQTYT